MMKKNNLFFLPLLLLIVSAEAQNDSTFTKKDIQGDWTCISVVQDVRQLATDDGADYYTYFPIGNLRIKGSEIMLLDYPCEFTSGTSLKFWKKRIYYEGDDNYPLNNFWIDKRNDTLIIKDGGPMIGGYTREYIRDTLNTEIIAKLKKDWLNPECMKGRWALIRYETGHDGSEHEYLNSINLPDTLNSQLKNYQTEGRYLILEIDGKPRKFLVTFYYDLFFRNMRLHLKMAEGTEEEKSGEIVYRKMEEW